MDSHKRVNRNERELTKEICRDLQKKCIEQGIDCDHHVDYRRCEQYLRQKMSKMEQALENNSKQALEINSKMSANDASHHALTRVIESGFVGPCSIAAPNKEISRKLKKKLIEDIFYHKNYENRSELIRSIAAFDRDLQERLGDPYKDKKLGGKDRFAQIIDLLFSKAELCAFAKARAVDQTHPQKKHLERFKKAF